MIGPGGVGSGVNPHLSVGEAISLQRGFECPQCLTCFSISSELILHQRIHHGINHPPQPTQTQSTPPARNHNHAENHSDEVSFKVEFVLAHMEHNIM